MITGQNLRQLVHEQFVNIITRNRAVLTKQFQDQLLVASLIKALSPVVAASPVCKNWIRVAPLSQLHGLESLVLSLADSSVRFWRQRLLCFRVDHKKGGRAINKLLMAWHEMNKTTRLSIPQRQDGLTEAGRPRQFNLGEAR